MQKDKEDQEKKAKLKMQKAKWLSIRGS